MNRNGILKAAIFEAGFTQKEFAKKVGMHESEISQALSGRLLLREDEKKRIANVLKRAVNELFPDKEVSLLKN